MSETYTEITLKNAGDVMSVERGYMKASEVRETTLEVLVDTGASTLVINEGMRKALGLRIKSTDKVTADRRSDANNLTETCQMTEPVEIHWKDRVTYCQAMVISGEGEVLLGAIPLESLDLTVNPSRQEVTGAHGDNAVFIAK
jgi:predicted aspartyl protease